MALFWRLRGHISEGCFWHEAHWAGCSAERQAQARALIGLTMTIAGEDLDTSPHTTLANQDVKIARARGDAQTVAWSLYALGRSLISAK